MDDHGLFRLNWSPRDEELSVDKIKENVNQNFKADFFFLHKIVISGQKCSNFIYSGISDW